MLYGGDNPKIAILFIACIPVFLLTMAGSMTASTAIVFPFVVAFMGMLRIPVGDKGTKGTENNKNDNKKKNNEAANTTKKTLPDKKKESKYAESSFLALGQAATSGAMLLLISTPPNLIAKSTVERFVPTESISFVDWFVIGTPHAIMGLLISWIVIFLLIKPEMRRLPVTREQFRSGLQKIGTMKREEKAVLTVLLFALSLWIVPSIFR
jgi:sodium-dependent dicarboxylate transporter 2/3/5